MHSNKTTWLNSLSVKVLLAYIIGVVLSIALVTGLIYWLVVYQSGILSGTDVLVLSDKMAERMQFDPMGNPIGFDSSDEDFEWIFKSLKQEAAYRVLNSEGMEVLVSLAGEAFWLPDDTQQRLLPGRHRFVRDGILVYSQIIKVKNEQQNWFLQVGVNARFYTIIYQGFALPFMGVGIFVFSLVLFVVFGACAIITLGYTLKPLRNVSESAASISPRSIHSRLLVKGVPTEISPLVDSFNRVLDRLEHGYRIQQEFLATAAHELKTPLALIRAQIEMKSESEDRALLLNDVAHMSRQVQQLLLLAEVSEDHNYTLSLVAVTDVIAEVIKYLQPMSQAAGLLVTVVQNCSASWQADRSALFILIKNLLENAIQHAPRGTNIQIELNPSSLTLRDWGPGVEPENLQHIFKRFWRGAHRRDHGAGLGLAICQEIAQAHDWILTARNAVPGLEFKITR